MLKFYRYVIYRVYSFFKKKDDTPIADVVFAMIVIHSFQIITVALFVCLKFGLKWNYIQKGNPIFYLIILAICLLYYLIVFYNGKWKGWIKEFRKESIEERRRNGIRVWLFCWGSIVLFFISIFIVVLLR